MSLSPQLQDLKARELGYEASQATKEQLRGKVLTTLIAPTAVGKSTLTKRVLELGGKNFSESYSVVTRARRADDPAEYKTRNEGYTIDRVVNMINAHELTNYTIHPSGNIYGAMPVSFPTQYSILPLLPSSLSALQRAGFSTVHAVYIVISSEEWTQRLPERQKDASYEARLVEAIESLSWAIAHSKELIFVENAEGALDHAAEIILDITRGQATDHSQERGVELAKDMLAFAQKELDHLKTQ